MVARFAPLLAVIALACGHPVREAPAQAASALHAAEAAATDTMTGVPAFGESAAALLTQEHGTVGLEGPVADELERAIGTWVRVQGRLTRRNAGAVMVVREYRVLSVNGVSVLDGVLARRATGPCFEVPEGHCLALTGLPPLPPGSRLWIRISWDDVVTGYGVLRNGRRP